jgi:dTDP-4-amino-4,6-dideoxygalactose transaminase
MNFNLDLMMPYRDEVRDAVSQVIDSGWYLGGKEIKAFENEWAAYTGQRFSVGVGNGTDAIRLALLALGIGPGDEVLTPAFNVAYTALAIKAVGATPVYVDSDDGYLVSSYAYAKAITSKTRAVVPVHLYGRVHSTNGSLRELADYGGFVMLEDAAQAHGAKDVGLGHATAYSFYPTKNMGALGEAGAVTTNIPIVAERIRLLRDAGRTDRYVHELRGGVNSMMDEIQAAVLRVKLKYLSDRNEQRWAAASYYDSQLKTPGNQPNHASSVHHLYVIRSTRRKELRDYLTAKGIPTLIHYPVPVPMQPIFVAESIDQGPWPNAEIYAREVLSLPMHADITKAEQDQVITAIKEFHAA